MITNSTDATIDSNDFIIQSMRKLKQRLDIEIEEVKKYKIPEGLQGSALASEKAYIKGALDEVVKFRQFIKDMGV
jgi:hypothetical protein